MNDVFISYARSDAAWVNEELVPALQELQATFFKDDAEWDKLRAPVEATGLLPSDNIADKLAAALQDSRCILLIQSPAYFASGWCRKELEVVEKLVASGSTVKPVYFVLERVNDRLDLGQDGMQRLYVDLTEVPQRTAKLAFGLQVVNPKASTLALKLGARSLRDLLREDSVEKQLGVLRVRQREFRAAHTRMQTFKEAHDAIQRAQDSWRTLANARDEITAGRGVPTGKLAADLLSKCDDILASLKAPALKDQFPMWRKTLAMGIELLKKVLADEKNLDVLNQALEITRGTLMLSTLAADLNSQMRKASQELPIGRLREALAPLKAVKAYSWQAAPLDSLTRLVEEFDSLEKLLTDIDDLVEVHDVLQNIDSIFAVAGHVEAKLINIEMFWPEIDQERKKFDPRMLQEMTWLQVLGTVVDGVNQYLAEQTRLEAQLKERIDTFKAQLNQSFNRADTDLRTETSLLADRHDNIEALLGELAETT